MISVLVIDDDFRVARVHAGFTEQVAGFRVVGNAHTAAEARAMVHEHRPDLVLLDVYLPDESGITLLSELDVDTMVLSAASDPDTVRAALRRGALNYLVKPFPPRRLADRLTAYARYRTAVARGGELSQVDVDRAVRFLREGDLPEGNQRKGHLAGDRAVGR